MKTTNFVMAVLAATSVAGAAYAAGMGKQTQIPPASLKWEQPYGPGGPSIASVSGDRVKGPFSLFFRLPSGYDSGWHTHDSDYTAVVLAGTVENVEQGAEADAAALPAGAVWTQPAKRNHATRCKPGAECLIYVSLKGGQTFHPMTADGKPIVAKK